MTPLRLMILAILFYVGWRLLRGVTGRSDSPPASGYHGDDASDKVRDTLIEDPVCHTMIPKKQAIRLRFQGRTFYFCSEKCCDQFLEQHRGEE